MTQCNMPHPVRDSACVLPADHAPRHHRDQFGFVFQTESERDE